MVLSIFVILLFFFWWCFSAWRKNLKHMFHTLQSWNVKHCDWVTVCCQISWKWSSLLKEASVFLNHFQSIIGMSFKLMFLFCVGVQDLDYPSPSGCLHFWIWNIPIRPSPDLFPWDILEAQETPDCWKGIAQVRTLSCNHLVTEKPKSAFRNFTTSSSSFGKDRKINWMRTVEKCRINVWHIAMKNPPSLSSY